MKYRKPEVLYVYIFRRYPSYELPPELPAPDYYRDVLHHSQDSPAKKLPTDPNQSIYSDKPTHDVIYDSALGSVNGSITSNDVTRGGSRRQGHMYEAPQIM